MPFLEEVAQFLSVARAVSYAPGARLVRQGEPSCGAYVLRSGKVEAQVALPGGGMLTVGELGDGDVFGEMALIERGVCSASVVARTTVEAWFIERDDFRALVASRDTAALRVQRAITRVLAGKLRTLNRRLREHAADEDRPARPLPSSVEGEIRAPGFDWRQFLPILPFFEGFEAGQIDEVVALGRVFEAPRGRWLFLAGAPASSCFVVVRGAVEMLSRLGERERRVALAGPGELIGHLALLEGSAHAASACVREAACLLELPAAAFLALYEGGNGTSVRLQHAIHRSLLRALTRSNNQLTRLIAAARLRGAQAEGQALEAARGGEMLDLVEQAH